MPRRPTTRRAYTLIELVVAMGSSAFLMGGLASALYVSSRALVPDATATDEDNRSALALAQASADLRLALSFTERTANAVTFTVPDRNGDSATETIRYSWTGTPGDPLLYQYNGNAAVTLAASVQQFNVSALTRTIPADALPTPPASVNFVSYRETTVTSALTWVTITTPPGATGDLMIAAVAVDDPFGNTLNTPAGWSLLNRTEYDSTVGLAVWWKFAGSSEPANYTFSWTDGRRAQGMIMRFSGVEATPQAAPAFLVNAGDALAVESLAMTTTRDNALALCIATVDSGDLTGGPANHTLIMQDGASTNVEAAAAYRTLPIAGTTGTAAFGHIGVDDFVAFTIVLLPDDGI